MRIPSVTFDLPAVGGKFEQWRNRDWHKYWMTSPEDRAALIYLLRSIEAETVAEIGIHAGYTARCLLDNVVSIRSYIGIDAKRGYVPTTKAQKTQVPIEPAKKVIGDHRLRLIVSTNGSLDIKASDLPNLDAIFIDGDHGYEVAKHDTNLARQTVRSGGLIIWHDYHEGSAEGVRDLLEEMFGQGAPIRHIAHTWLAFETVTPIDQTHELSDRLLAGA